MSYLEKLDELSKAEFEYMKQVINYDSLVASKKELIKNKVIKTKLEILQKEKYILGLENSIKQIDEEVNLSDYKYKHIYIDPYSIYNSHKEN